MGINGITVTLYTRTQNGTDAFGTPTYTETAVTVDDVLVSPKGTDELTERTNLNGDVTTYQLAIPKGDTHTWEGNRVSFFGLTFKVIGFEVMGIDDMIPLRWNKKVTVERIG